MGVDNRATLTPETMMPNPRFHDIITASNGFMSQLRLSSFNSMEVKDVRSDPEKNDAKGPVVKGIPLTPGWGDAPGNAPGVVPGSRDGRLSAQPPAVRFPEEEQRRMVAADWKCLGFTVRGGNQPMVKRNRVLWFFVCVLNLHSRYFCHKKSPFHSIFVVVLYIFSV